jgi:hypothetical protein
LLGYPVVSLPLWQVIEFHTVVGYDSSVRGIHMPLLDHFHSPLKDTRHWEGFHSAWANGIVAVLNQELLPEEYFAEANIHMGPRIEVDVATMNGTGHVPESNSGEKGSIAIATRPARTWTPPAATFTIPTVFVDTFEVLVFNSSGGPTLVAAIEFVSPGNKDRAENRNLFAIKCASYIANGASLNVVDVVTDRHANLHDEIMKLVCAGERSLFPGSPPIYASAYRPVHRKDGDQFDVWLSALEVGRDLPKLPLGISHDLILPIDLEATYMETCRKLRILK